MLLPLKYMKGLFSLHLQMTFYKSFHTLLSHLLFIVDGGEQTATHMLPRYTWYIRLIFHCIPLMMNYIPISFMHIFFLFYAYFSQTQALRISGQQSYFMTFPVEHLYISILYKVLHVKLEIIKKKPLKLDGSDHFLYWCLPIFLSMLEIFLNMLLLNYCE